MCDTFLHQFLREEYWTTHVVSIRVGYIVWTVYVCGHSLCGDQLSLQQQSGPDSQLVLLHLNMSGSVC